MAKVNVNPPQLSYQDIQRFWKHVDKSPGYGPKGECWKWTKGTVGQYGSFGTYRDGQKRNHYSHRLAFFLYTGRWSSLFICHECDWPLCCNPSHLFEGSQMDNLRDAKTKGRHTRGERQWLAKLTANDVCAIRRLGDEGMKQKDIAKRFGVTPSTVCLIVNRKRTWKHV